MTSKTPAPLWRPGDPVEPLRELLRRGGVLAIPTESSYGLGADPRNRIGVEAIYRIKGRAPGKALPVVVAGPEQLADLGIDPALPILKALAAFWPGPLTLVVPIDGAIARTVSDSIPAAGGDASLAVRVPDHAGLLGLLRNLGHGLTATSANRSGEEAIVDPGEAAVLLAGEDAAVVDGGILPGGPPSTLVAIEKGGAVVLRTGRFPVDRLQEALRPLGVTLRTAHGEEA